MLIGKRTPLNETLHEAIGYLVPGAKLFSPKEFLAADFNASIADPVVFINLTDLTNEENALISKIKDQVGKPKIVGIHTFMVPEMRDQILARGFDAYLSFFEFSEKIEELLESFGIKLK